jgi:hypothetical protein
VEPVLVVAALLCGLFISRTGPMAVVAAGVGLAHGALLDMVSTTGGFHVANLLLGGVAALAWAFVAHTAKIFLTRRRAG